jgi:hypothetical protein
VALSAPSAPESLIEGGARIRERLLARAAADVAQPKSPATPLMFTVAPSAAPSASVQRRPARWLAIAAGVLFVAGLTTLGLSLRGRQDLVDALKAQATLTEASRHTVDSLRDQLATRDSLIAGIMGRDVTVMTLTSQSAKDPYARMFWDHARRSWTMVAHNMPDLKNGRTYQLWLVTPKAKISAGTFVPRNGDAVVRATYDLTDPLSAIAVTDEPAGGVPQPTGPVIVATQTR